VPPTSCVRSKATGERRAKRDCVARQQASRQSGRRKRHAASSRCQTVEDKWRMCRVCRTYADRGQLGKVLVKELDVGWVVKLEPTSCLSAFQGWRNGL